VREFWAQRFRPSGDESDKTHCVVCGQLQYPLRRMQMKVKGIRGGNKAGTALISGDVMAAQSYGLLESTVSSICFECGDRTTAALNHLLRYDSSHLSTGDSTFVYWTRAPVAFSLKILSDPQPADVEALLTSVQRGKPPGSVDSDAFYAAAFSGSGGRAVVRDWIDTTVDEAKRQVARWFRLQEIVAWNGERGEYLGLNRLAMATIPMRGGKADWARLSPLVPRQLLRTALTGEPLPSQLLAAAINRSRADRRVPRERAALVKVIILSRPEGNLAITKEKYMVGLDPEHPSGAYHCGRLLATLDRIQGEAIVSMEAGARVGARYFGTASSAPASVFPRLGRVAVHHLATLSHENPRSFRYLSRQLRDVLGRITVTTGAAELEASHRLTELPGFPPILTLAEQGLFLLGFYHQQAYRTTRLADDTSNPNINEQSDPDVDDNGCASDFCTGE